MAQIAFTRYQKDACNIAQQLGKPLPKFIRHPIVDMETPDFEGFKTFLNGVRFVYVCDCRMVCCVLFIMSVFCMHVYVYEHMYVYADCIYVQYVCVHTYIYMLVYVLKIYCMCM